jgi:hypothetical protein
MILSHPRNEKNLHDTAVLGILKILERFSYFAYILAQENDKTLNFF